MSIEVFQFFTEISIIEQLAKTRMERALPDGIRAPHFGVLNHLQRTGEKRTPAELAATFQVTRPSMTNTIQRLEEKGYVTVEPDPQDGRGKLVTITPAGSKALMRAIGAMEGLFSPMMEDLGTEIFAEALPALQKIRAYLDAHRN